MSDYNIGIFQDVHANLPALQKALEVFREHKCTAIYHVGDFIGIGPQPKEVFELGRSIPELVFIMGNHDYWYGFGLPDPKIHPLSTEEIAHQKWTHQQIGESGRAFVRSWKFVERRIINNQQKIAFLHYGYDQKRNWFKTFLKTTTVEKLDHLFLEVNADIIFYGHQHIASDFVGQSRYVNLGSAGCWDRPEVRLGILQVKDDTTTLKKLSVPYDDDGFMEVYEERKVPARDFIKKHFVRR